MKHRWAALVFVLAFSGFMPKFAAAQSSTPPPPEQRPRLELGQNYPNPFNPETKIPFAVGDYPICSEPNRQYRVTLRVYNLLAQLVAEPILQAGTGSAMGGRPLKNLLLTCNQYIAYWDGKYLNTAREVASGIYLYRLEVDGRAVVKKMIVTK